MNIGRMLSYCVLICLISACKISPEEIQYNQDECAFCKMRITDNRFGAELVTRKGKVYKYDSAECLFRSLSGSGLAGYEFIMVTDFTEPEVLIDARSATFLVSPNRQSPMGGDLSAYGLRDKAVAVKEGIGGTLYSFDEMLKRYQESK